MFISKLKPTRVKNIPGPNSHRCQASSDFVLRRERIASSGGTDTAGKASGSSLLSRRTCSISSGSWLRYSSTRVRVAGLASPYTYTGSRSIWEAAEFLNTLVDNSDPDTDLTQIEHLLQTSEAIGADGHPRWFVLDGFVHDLGKVLCLWGEPQWGVVGDTFPVGCAYSEHIVFPEFFAANPDLHHPVYSTKYGIYEPNYGLDNVHLSFGHDGYIYEAMKKYLPEEALYMLRYHSFYPAHKHGAYRHLMNDHDVEMFRWVNEFNKYDLYSKGHAKPTLKELKPYYDDLFAEFFPEKIAW